MDVSEPTDSVLTYGVVLLIAWRNDGNIVMSRCHVYGYTMCSHADRHINGTTGTISIPVCVGTLSL